MRLTIAYSKTKKRNLVLINNATHQRETLSERPIRQPLSEAFSYGIRYIWHLPTSPNFLLLIPPCAVSDLQTKSLLVVPRTMSSLGDRAFSVVDPNIHTYIHGAFVTRHFIKITAR